MRKKNQLIAMIVMSCMVLFASCNKEDNNPNEPTPTPTPTPTASKAFLNLTFNTTNAYFSTDGSMTAPVDSNQAQLITNKIDITYIYNHDYSKPGFFDPKARSQEWYWDDYYKPWLNTAVETRFYTTTLTITEFDAAKNDQSKIATYFANASTVLAPHAIFPTGSCIGGRQSDSPTSVLLEEGQVFGFKNTSSGKRGLILIRYDQNTGWPYPITGFDTKVDIIREN